MDDETTIDDLPVECVEEILKWIIDCADRNSARLVCKFWWRIMNGVSFPECCHIDLKIVKRTNNQKTMEYNNSNRIYRMINFNKLIPQFLDFKRKINSFHFDKVDFQNSEQFWEEKGADIKLLQIDAHASTCEHIPFVQIFENCNQLKSLKLLGCSHSTRDLEIVNSLKSRITEGKSNSFLRSLYLEVIKNVDEIIDMANLVNLVFPQLENMHFEHTSYNFNWPAHFDRLCACFKNLNFKKIVYSDSDGKNKFTFDLSAADNELLIKIERLKFEEDTNSFRNDNFLLNQYRSNYNCDFIHLKQLHLSLVNFPHGQCELDLNSIISQSPSLEKLWIHLKPSLAEGSKKIIFSLTQPLNRNNIQFLNFNFENWHFRREPRDIFSINDVFLQSFKYLKSFECHHLLYSEFVKLLRHLGQLEVLSVDEGTVDEIHELAGPISNGSLKALKMPNVFLFQKGTTYEFDNLKQLRNARDFVDAESVSDLDNRLKRMICPKILKLDLDFQLNSNDGGIDVNEDEYVQLISNILSHFSTLNELRIAEQLTQFQNHSFCYEKLQIIKAAHPTLRTFQFLQSNKTQMSRELMYINWDTTLPEPFTPSNQCEIPLFSNLRRHLCHSKALKGRVENCGNSAEACNK